jgi:hypothetical protein
MSGQHPPVKIIDGEVQIELTENKTSCLPLMMTSMANNVQHDLAHSFVADICCPSQAI